MSGNGNDRYDFDDLSAAPAAAATQQQSGQSNEFRDLGRGRQGLTPVFNRGSNSGIIKEFKEGLDIVIANNNLQGVYAALAIEGSKLANKRPVDLVVLVHTDTHNGKEYQFIAPVLFELRNGQSIPDKIENLGAGNQNIIQQYTEDMIGGSLSRDLVAFVKAASGKDSARAYVCAPLIFPSHATFSKDDELAREDYAAALSVKIREARVRTDQEVPVDEVRKEILDKSITATFFNSEGIGANAVTDREGNPVRSDFRAILNAPTALYWTENDQQTSVQPAVTAHAYLDLIYEGEPDEQMIARGLAKAKSQIYTPLITMTRVENSISGDATLSHLAAGIAAILASHNGQRVYQHWMPSLFKKGQYNKVHDIGAINYDLARLDPEFDPKKIKDAKFETSSNKFNDLQAFQFISKVVRPSVALAYDARQIGENSHIDMVLLEAAEYQGEAGSGNGACETIVRYFDAATNGHFARILAEYRRLNPQAGQLKDIIFANAGADRAINIPYGYFIDSDNVRRDIREYTSILPYLNAFGATSDDLLNDANDAFHRRGLTRGERQNKQFKLFELMIAANQYKIRGTHYRLLFSSAFLSIYAQALQASGVRISVNDAVLPGVVNSRADTGAIYSNANFSGYGGIITNNMFGAGAVRQGAGYTLAGVNGVGFM